MWTINICWNNWSKITLIFFMIASIHCINHSFCIGIPFIWCMWRTIMNLKIKERNYFPNNFYLLILFYHCFIDGIGCFIRKNTSWKTRNKFFNLIKELMNLFIFFLLVFFKIILKFLSYSKFTTALHDIIINKNIFTKEFHLRMIEIQEE